MQQSPGSQTSSTRILVGVSTKMYLGYRDSLDWLERLRHEVDTRPALAAGRVVPFVIPSFPVLPAAARLLAGSPLLLGAQNCGWADGPWTGEVAPSMLAELGVRLVEIGHAERRRHFNEDDAMVALKVRAADDAGLTPLLCVGEPTAGSRRLRRTLCTARSSRPSTATGTSPAAWWWRTNRSGPSARPSRPPPPTCPTSSSRLRDQLTAAGVPGLPVIYGGSAKPGLLPTLEGVSGLFLGRFAHDPVNFGTVLDEALVLAEGLLATDPATVGHVQP